MPLLDWQRAQQLGRGIGKPAATLPHNQHSPASQRHVPLLHTRPKPVVQDLSAQQVAPRAAEPSFWQRPLHQV